MSIVDPLTPAELLAVRALLAPPTPPPAPGQTAASPPGFIADVAPGNLIASATWGNPIRDASTIRFASIADRDANWPAATAPDGALCVTVDFGVLWQRNTQSGAPRWTRPWHLAWGVIATKAIAATGIGAGTTVDINGATIGPIAFLGGRLYLAGVDYEAQGGGTAMTVTTTITNSANAALPGSPRSLTVAPSALANIATRCTFSSSGTDTIKARCNPTQNLNITDARGTFTLTDMGPQAFVPFADVRPTDA